MARIYDIMGMGLDTRLKPKDSAKQKNQNGEDIDFNGLTGGISSILGGIASAYGNNANTEDTSAIENDIEDLRSENFDYGSFDELQQAALAQRGVAPLTADQLRGSTGLERFGNTLKGTLDTAIGGMQATGSPYGALFGFAGLGAGILGSAIGDLKAESEAKRLNLNAQIANDRNMIAQAQNAERIGNKTFNNSLLNMAALGGLFNNMDNFDKSMIRLKAYGGDIDNPSSGMAGSFVERLNLIGTGGSHETNPFGGVMLGVDPEGVPNLAEEGETVLDNNYVFSKRLKADGGILESVMLPKKYQGMSFADISLDLAEEGKNRLLDPISKAGFDDAMMKLVTAQEAVRQREQEYKDFEELENTFADGGSINIKPSKRGTFTAAAKARGMGVQEFASKVLANKDKYSTSMVKKAVFAHNFGGRKKSFGGNLFPNGGFAESLRFAPVVGSAFQVIGDDLGWTNKEDYTNPNIIRDAARSVRNVTSSPIGGYVAPQRFDTDFQSRQLMNAGLGTQRSMMDLAGGNRGTARNNMLAFNNNLINQRGNLYRQALEQQRDNDLRAAVFNLGINQFNSQQNVEAQRANQAVDLARINAAAQEAQMRDNIQSMLSATRSVNRTGLYNNLGQVGVDAFNRNSALEWLTNKGLLDQYNEWKKAQKSGTTKKED